MSYFTGDQDQKEATPSEENQEQSTDFLGKIAEVKGEKWKDPNVVAKGYLDSQQFIEQLKQENATMRSELDKGDYMKELLETLKQQQGKPAGGENASEKNTSTSDTANQAVASVENIKSLIAETLTQTQQQELRAKNLDTVDKHMESQFGTEASKKIEERRQQLGLTKEQLIEMAGTSPQAFFTLMGTAPSKDSNTVPGSALNTEGSAFNSNSNLKNWKYYQQMRKENPRQYRSPKVQNEMALEAQRQGTEFYK